jgi:hypothetical protein
MKMTPTHRARHAGPRPAGGVVLGAFGCTKAPSSQEVVLLALAYSSDEWLSHSQRVVLGSSFLTVNGDSTTVATPVLLLSALAVSSVSGIDRCILLGESPFSRPRSLDLSRPLLKSPGHH